MPKVLGCTAEKLRDREIGFNVLHVIVDGGFGLLARAVIT